MFKARPALVALLALCGLLPLATPALAATVVTKTGKFDAQEYYPTYTALVVITPDFTMKIIPTDQVLSIDGVPYARAYWGASSKTTAVAQSSTTAVAGPLPVQALLPLTNGTTRVYDVTELRSTWLRHGLKMQRQPDETLEGQQLEAVAARATGTTTETDRLTLAAPGKPAQSAQAAQVVRTLTARPDGTYLLDLTRDDARLRPSHQVSHLSVPARLWPTSLALGDTWVVGPYDEFGAASVMRMQVVGRETVTVPAGTYPDAYKVQGFGHVCGGHVYTPDGRLVNEVGIVERQVWLVPGLGPVKDVERLHLHEDYFPSQGKLVEQPFVFEVRQTSELREFSLGAR